MAVYLTYIAFAVRQIYRFLRIYRESCKGYIEYIFAVVGVKTPNRMGMRPSITKRSGERRKMKREFLQELRVGETALPKEVIDAIMAENGKDIQTHRQAAQQWEEKYNRAVSDHAAQMEKLQLEGYVQSAVNALGGRNLKAIAALLDMTQLQTSQDPKTAVEQAVAKVKEDNDYLFASAVTPAPYARDTGTQRTQPGQFPNTLAGALKEKFRTGIR